MAFSISPPEVAPQRENNHSSSSEVALTLLIWAAFELPTCGALGCGISSYKLIVTGPPNESCCPTINQYFQGLVEASPIAGLSFQRLSFKTYH